LLINRVLYGYDTYLKKAKERRNDELYFKKVCSTIDYKDLGQHAATCVDTEHRLGTSVLFQTAKHVVDDTLYRELSFGLMSQVAAVTSGIFVVGYAHNKYQRTLNQKLPVHKKLD
jgi:hypothetical protein